MTTLRPEPAGWWWRWVAANSVGELVGLGTVAALGYLVASRAGEPTSIGAALGLAAVFVALGAIEGVVVGAAQARVLRQRLPELSGWVGATVLGAVVSWAIGMAPSTIMSARSGAGEGPPPEIGLGLRLALAAGLGLVAGPLLAWFQWRRLRRLVPHAAWWLPANGAAWAAGMPVIFAGVHVAVAGGGAVRAVLVVASALALAGALVGAIHGWALGRLLARA